jgi:DNA-binding MarR family transcriptional regulator
MDNANLWNLVQVSGRVISQNYLPVLERFMEKSGLDGREISLLIAVRTFEPDYTTPAHLLVRDPYSSAELYFSRLATVARQGYLGEVSRGEFRLTPEGRDLVTNFIQEARSAMVDADPLPAEESQQLAMILGKLIHSCLETPPFPNPWSIGLSFKLMPDPDPPLPYTEQAISCLSAYRDDSHLAAWRETGLSATALETLTLVWRKQADTLSEVVERLSYRGHPSDVYVDAVDELEAKGYLKGLDNQLEVTDQGKEFRDQIERDTNRYFFAPWDNLDDEERLQLETLLKRLVA